MTDHVRITDVSPRDGLQNEPGVVPTCDKVKLISLLAASGVDEIEATSFVSPKWVPQLGDAAAVLTKLQKHGWSDGCESPTVSVLVPNEQGYERALAFHSEEFPLKIALFTAASQTFNMKNTNATIAESIARFGAFLPDAIERGMRIRLYVSCVVACPFEGRIEPASVRDVCDQLLDLVSSHTNEAGAVELDLGDTIGAATPDDIEQLLDIFTLEERAGLTVHLHDTFGRAADCVRRALEMGVRSFDGSVAGLGGCPYAGTKEKPAPGNISTESLLKAIGGAGYTARVNLPRLAEASEFACAIAGTGRRAPGITPS